MAATALSRPWRRRIAEDELRLRYGGSRDPKHGRGAKSHGDTVQPEFRRRREAELIMRTVLTACVVAMLAGCAGPEPDQEVTLVTTPEGAACGLHRDGEALALISQTPSFAVVPPGAAPLRVVCHREGHRPVTTLIRPKVGAEVIGSLRAIAEGLGGAEPRPLTGGAYPTEVAVGLPPIDPALLAPLPPERAALIEERLVFHAARLRALRDDCRAAPYAACELALAEVARERDTELASLDPTLGLVPAPR